VIDQLLKEEEDRLNQYMETLRYRSAPHPFGSKHRPIRGDAISHDQPIRDGNMQTNETYADRIDEDYEEDDEEQADTQDDEIILVDDDDDEADEDMDLDDEEIVRSPSPPPSNLEQAHQEPNDRATVHSSSDEGAATSSDANPLTWDFRRLR
ncbi:hypothetical protein DYB32_003371, partial [Aphanomyces invadans]